MRSGKMKAETHCAQCGTLFVSKRRNNKYCSRLCAAKSWRDKNRKKLDKYNTKRRRPILILECAYCEKPFQKRRGKTGLYCSNKCRNKAKWANPAKRKEMGKKWTEWRAKNKARYVRYHNDYYNAQKIKWNKNYPWRSLLRGAKSRAAKNGLLFDLDIEWAKNRWTGFCEMTGLSFSSPERRVGYKRKNFSPSIDRISCEKGYTKENCRFVLWCINAFKATGTDSEIYRVAAAMLLMKGFTIQKPQLNGTPNLLPPRTQTAKDICHTNSPHGRDAPIENIEVVAFQTVWSKTQTR